MEMLAWLQGYAGEGASVETGGRGRQRPPSLDDGLSERPSFTPADVFLCFCLDFFNMRTCRHGNQERQLREHGLLLHKVVYRSRNGATLGPAAETTTCPGGWSHGSPSTWTGTALLSTSLT